MSNFPYYRKIHNILSTKNADMISLNESIDFEFFETPSKSTKTSEKLNEKDPQLKTGISGSILELWEFDSGSLKHSRSNASLLNNLAFESNTDIVVDARKVHVNRGSSSESYNSQTKSKAKSRWDEIKRTVALTSDEDCVDYEIEDSSSCSYVEESPNKTSVSKDKQHHNELKDPYLQKTHKLKRSKTIDESEDNECDIVNNGNISDAKENQRQESKYINEKIDKNNDAKSAERSESCERTVNKNMLNTEKESRTKSFEMIEEEIVEIDVIEDVRIPEKRIIDTRSKHEDHDDILYVCGENQITTVVEIHAENDLSDEDNIDRDTIQDNGDDNLIANEEAVELETGKIITIITNESEMDLKLNMNRHQNDEEEGNDCAINTDNKATDRYNTKENDIEDIHGNDKNNNIQDNKDYLSQFASETILELNNEMEVTQKLNQIKKYTAINSVNIEQIYSYEEIEKKIETANKHMMDVKTLNVIDTKKVSVSPETDKMSCTSTNNNVQLESSKINKTTTNIKLNKTIRNTTNLTKLLQQSNTPNSRTKAPIVQKPIDKETRVMLCGRKISPRQEQLVHKPIENEAKMISRSKSSPRPELPKLNKQPHTKQTSGIKPNLKKLEDKIPDIKNEAAFDMRLLIKAINDLENTKPKSTNCTRSNSGRSSEISKKSSNSNKSTASTSRRSNMSFTKEELKKIDVENQILLKKIMSQKPQHPPEPGSQIRRKPTAYINRQRLQDRISHDNMVSRPIYHLKTVQGRY
uniref:Uncharacterized protein n=1 Tax=Cacopsylla melanoneura TaxID=428564 RepID=A0A8D9E885_9HEMI